MRFEKVTVTNDDGRELSARLDVPVADDPVAYALFAHCFSCTDDLRSVGRITSALAEKGIATLRLDFTGLGEGDLAGARPAPDISDLAAAARHMAESWAAPQIVIGHSLGGAAALAAAPDMESIEAIATIAAPSSSARVEKLLVDQDVDDIRRTGKAAIRLDGRPFEVSSDFLDALDESELPHALSELRLPLLIAHSPVDTLVGVESAAELFMAAKHPKSYLSLDNADHLLTRDEDARYVGGVIAAWSARYLDADPREELQADLRREGPEIGTSARTERELRTEVMAHGFALVADEPESAGGTNLGPTPYDLLTAALGACTSMTLRIYADRKGWPLDAVTVHLNHNKVHARDCAKCETEEGKIDHIQRRITLEGDLDDAQRKRLVEIADRCPVHKTLQGEIHVENTLVS